MKSTGGVKFDNGSRDHIAWLEEEIGSLRQSISLTRTLLGKMTAANRQNALLLIRTNQKKIADLDAIIERYHELVLKRGVSSREA